MTQKVIHWFRQDLRLHDNPSLAAAVKAGEVLAVYILDDVNAGQWRMGGASRWWLHHALASLNESLGGGLNVYSGDAREALAELVARHDVKAVFWNRCYEPWRIARDAEVKQALKARHVEVQSFNASLLWEPWEVLKQDGSPYKVFTPFYRKGCLGAKPPREPINAPATAPWVKDERALALDALKLLPEARWGAQLAPHWRIGEEGARAAFYAFLDNGLQHYKHGRDFPAKHAVSRLSPYLHFGEISPHQVWNAARLREADANSGHFCSELAWREFSYYLLYHQPQLPVANLQKKFDAFPWRKDAAVLARWQKGQTGFPLVDAGMRELWQTGYMHNRVRMVVASFLVKNLLIDWREGAAWFWDCLVDADLANNSASWQWVAGSGADAAPFFRIFNPVTQGQKHDADGEYIRTFVPELAALPDKYLFSPWLAPAVVLAKAGVELGKTYPAPMLDIAATRTRALEAFAAL